MAFNGAGVYSPPATDFPAVSNTLIQATKFNNVINDIATGLSTCLTKDGQQTVTANIPFAGFYATNVGIRHIDGSVGTPGLAWNSDASSGFYRIGANDYGYAVAGVKVQETTAAAHTLSQNLLFSADNTYDIGASGATRARDFFLGRNATVTGTGTFGSTLQTSGNLRVIGAAVAAIGIGAATDYLQIEPQAAGSGVIHEYLNAAGSDFTPVILNASSLTFKYRTGAATTAAGLTIATATGLVTIANNLVVSGTGPHAIGGATNSSVQLHLTGSFTTGGTNADGIYLSSTLIPAVNGNAFGIELNPTLNKAGSGTHPDFAALFISAPTINAGAATLTNATTLKITGAPSVGTNQRALWVAAGLSQFDGQATFTNSVNVFTSANANGTEIDINNTSARNFAVLSTGASWGVVAERSKLIFYDVSGGVTMQYMSSAGIVNQVATTLNAAITYGGVTLSNSVTGTGSMVLSDSPVITTKITAAAHAVTGTPATAGGFRGVYGVGAGGPTLTCRNSGDTANMTLISSDTRNAVVDCVMVGLTSTNGVVLKARSGSAAPTTSDLGVSEWCLWRDTGGATTKLYYNNAGAIQAVALA